MRLSALLIALLPAAALADDIPLSSAVTAVTLYPLGATVTREVAFSIPAGSHSLILTDLPRTTPLASVRVAAEAEGAALGSVSARRDFVPPRDPGTDAAIATAEAEVERLEAALRDGEAGVETLRLAAEAARARIGFLKALGGVDGLSALEPETLRALVAMIGEETLSALNAAHDATRRAADADRALKELRAELKRARQALAALVPETESRAMLAVALTAAAPAEGTLSVTYTIDEAGWQPVYDLRLDRAGGRLAIERGALVSQATGENWRDVALRLSTSRPSQRTEPGEVWPWLRRIADPEDSMPKPLVRAEVSTGAAMEDFAIRPAPVVAAPEFEGLSVSYAYPDPVSVASGADSLRIALGGVGVDADPVAEAAPLSDSTAYLVARIVNTTGEPVLPTDEASFYLDGRFIARRALGSIPAGGKAELAFGPVEGLRLTRIVLDRNEGDRGVITRSNQITEEVRIEVENLTAETWPLRLLDRVPYSEQEDLRIEWSATPRPVEENVDGKRGVLAWEFDLAPGETGAIALKHRLQWPDGMVLE